MSTRKQMAVEGCRPLVLIILILLMTGSAGCIKAAQNALSGGSPTGESSSQPVVTTMPTVSQADFPQRTPTASPVFNLTPEKSDLVTEVTPDVTPDPYVFPQAIQINKTPLQSSFLYRTPEFRKIYTLRGNAIGLLVNVVQGPLYIVYTVNPMNDCLEDAESCRGSNPTYTDASGNSYTTVNSVNNPYMTITVRDNQTNEIVAEDGYGRQYSSDTGTYQFSNNGNLSTSVNGQTTVTSVSVPGPRYIPIYSAGQFQITMQGDYLSVDLSIITGTSLNPLDTTENSQKNAPT